jgi:hypothetical protein
MRLGWGFGASDEEWWLKKDVVPLAATIAMFTGRYSIV